MDGKTVVIFLLLFLYGTEVMANIYNNLSSLIDGKEQEEDYSYRDTKIALHGKYKVKFFNDMKQIVGAIG